AIAAPPKASAASRTETVITLCFIALYSFFECILSAVEFAHQKVTHHLDGLHHDDQNGHRGEHYIGLITLITIPNGDVAQAAAADDTGHGGIADQDNGGD